MWFFASRAFWLGLIAMALAYGGSWWLRERFVEPSDVALVCNVTPHPGWCSIHFAILAGQHNLLFGAGALVVGLVALFRGGRGPAIAAAALSVVAESLASLELFGWDTALAAAGRALENTEALGWSATLLLLALPWTLKLAARGRVVSAPAAP